MKQLQKLQSLILGYLTKKKIYKAQVISFSLNSGEALPRIISGLETQLWRRIGKIKKSKRRISGLKTKFEAAVF